LSSYSEQQEEPGIIEKTVKELGIIDKLVKLTKPTEPSNLNKWAHAALSALALRNDDIREKIKQTGYQFKIKK